MDRRLMQPDARRWFTERTAGAPEVLRARAEAFALKAPDASPVDQLAGAGEAALLDAIRAGKDRAAALDLLAADGLITLALLAQAEQDPAALGPVARALRLRAGGA